MYRPSYTRLTNGLVAANPSIIHSQRARSSTAIPTPSSTAVDKPPRGMELMNVFRGLKKSQSGPNLTFSERISLARKSKREKGRSSGLESPLPPRPPSRSSGAPAVSKGRAIENIPENRVYDIRNGRQSEPQLHIKGRISFSKLLEVAIQIFDCSFLASECRWQSRLIVFSAMKPCPCNIILCVQEVVSQFIL